MASRTLASLSLRREENAAAYGEQKAACGLDGDDLAAAMELPLEWLTRDRVAVLEAMVAGKVGGLCRAAVFFQVGRCGYGNDAGLHSERDCCGIC